jgi:V-type H+-transporting ATPase subunit a
MFGGTCLKGANAIFFDQKYDFYFEFIPMVIFASSLFVYMVFLIFLKWSINWDQRMLSATGKACDLGYGQCLDFVELLTYTV